MLPPADPCVKKTYDRGARRREKSRDAARCRRQQESDTYNEICNVIPIPSKTLAQMDRSTVMRLLVSFMKLRSVVKSVEFNRTEIKCEDSSSAPDDEEYINALNGFIIVTSHDCDLLYVSTNVKQYIGMTSLDLIGQNLFGYTHEGDHSEITNCLKGSSEKTENHSFFMRMKSTLTSSGRNVNLKSATYKVLKCEGVVHHASESKDTYMVAYCEPIPHPANIELVLDCNTFLSQHSLDMKFTFCDNERVGNLLGYSDKDMNGKSLYDFCHTEDIKSLDDVMRKLFRLGQVTTNQYRLLAKYGGYVWITTQATIINNPRNQQPSYVVCVNHIVSELMEANGVMGLDQLENISSKQPVIVKQEKEEISLEQHQPHDCTESMFCDNSNSMFCDSTDSIFCNVDSGNTSSGNIKDDKNPVLPISNLNSLLNNETEAANLTDMFHVESFENLCNHAPSIGDPKWNQPTNEQPDFLNDLCNNAPSIGDPQWSPVSSSQEDNESLFTGITVNVDRVKDYLKGEYANRETRPYQMSSAGPTCSRPDDRTSPYSYSSASTSTSPLMPVTPPSRKLPAKGGFQIVSIPKTQFQRHVQLPAKRQVDLYDNVYKDNPPEYDYPPNKKTKCPLLCSPSQSPHQNDYRNVSDATQLLLGGQMHKDRRALTSLLLQNGHKCGGNLSSPEPRSSPWELCRNRDFSQSPNISPKLVTDPRLPVLSLHDCEVNAPIHENLSTVDWMALSSALGI